MGIYRTMGPSARDGVVNLLPTSGKQGDIRLIRLLGTGATSKLLCHSLDGVQLLDGLDCILQQNFAQFGTKACCRRILYVVQLV